MITFQERDKRKVRSLTSIVGGDYDAAKTVKNEHKRFLKRSELIYKKAFHEVSRLSKRFVGISVMETGIKDKQFTVTVNGKIVDTFKFIITQSDQVIFVTGNSRHNAGDHKGLNKVVDKLNDYKYDFSAKLLGALV
jgi:hypothetical protein